MNVKSLMVLGIGVYLLTSGRQVDAAKLSSEEMKALKAQLKAEILAELRAEQAAKEKAEAKILAAKSKKQIENKDRTQVLADNEKKPIAESVSDKKYKGYMKVGSGNNYLKIDGRIILSTAYANHPVGKEYEVDLVGKAVETQYRTSEFLCGAQGSRFGFRTITPMVLGGGEKEIKARIEMDLAGGGSKYIIRCRHAYVDMGSLLIGRTDSLFNDDITNMMSGVDATVPFGGCCIRQEQIRYTYDVRDDIKWTTSLENSKADGVNKNGTSIEKDDPAKAGTFDIVPDLVSRLAYKFEKMELAVIGLLRYLRIRHRNDRYSRKVGAAVGVGGKFYLTDRDIFTASLRVGSGAGRYICDGNIAGVYVESAEENNDGRNIVRRQQSMGSVLAIQHYWDKTKEIQSNLGIGYSYASLASALYEKKANVFRSGLSVHTNLIWTPWKDVLDIGTEYVYGYAFMATKKHIIVNRVAFGLTYKF